MGTRANSMQWASVTEKWKSRVKAIADTHAASGTATLNYTRRALPVLGYVAQLTLPPETFFRAERGQVLHLWHMATNSLDNATLLNLKKAGHHKYQSIHTRNACACCKNNNYRMASSARAAAKSCRGRTTSDQIPRGTLIASVLGLTRDR